MVKILLLFDYSSGFTRRLLKGLVQYSREFGPWMFYRVPSYFNVLYGKEGVVKLAKEWKANAIIAQCDYEGMDLLKGLGIPILLQNFENRSSNFSNLTGDYFNTGVMAAQFFKQKNFKNFAFYGCKNVIWSRERAEGYRIEIEKIGANYYYFETESLNESKWSDNYILLGEWLKSLPKPIALFACDDNFALHVSEICRIHNIQIPNEISLLGVDNDELICNLSDPPISSIVLDVEKGGYEAGRLIYKMITEETVDPINIVITPTRIESRLSTEKYNISNKYILKVVKYIEDNYASDFSIEDLTRSVPFSRRTLEVKFKNELGTTIYQFIQKCRIDHFSDLLLKTDCTLFDLAIKVGFKDFANISRVFRKYKGSSPIEYQQKNKKIENYDVF